uniref:Uncharacterized protein n=1 Tax=viral metagenome TaxID=1070528 RepID=A0A6C0I338_9ZZZZ
MYTIVITEYLFIFIIFSCIGVSCYYIVQYLFRRKEIEDEEIRKEKEELKRKEREEAFGLKDLADIPKKITRGFNDLSGIGDKIKGGFEKVGDIFQEIVKGFKQVGDKFKNIGDGLKYSFEGIGDTFDGLGEGLTTGFDDIGRLFKYTGLFTFSYLECGGKFIANVFTYCVMFYLFDIAKQIFYAPFRFVFWVISWSGLNIYKMVDSIWALIYLIDDTMNKYAGFSVFSYTRAVRNDCYYCRRMKKSALKRIAEKVDYDFNVELPAKLNKGQDKFDRAKTSFDELVGAPPKRKPRPLTREEIFASSNQKYQTYLIVKNAMSK